jgi:hypothetical protein
MREPKISPAKETGNALETLWRAIEYCKGVGYCCTEEAQKESNGVDCCAVAILVTAKENVMQTIPSVLQRINAEVTYR